MINFFRKKRKSIADDNKALKYARYAIGEIVLVYDIPKKMDKIHNFEEEMTRDIEKENSNQ